MKFTIPAIAALIALHVSDGFSQAPQGINFQSVIRNDSGEPIPNQQVNVIINISSSPNSATPAYRESHNTTSDAVGQMKLTIGNGTAITGTFNAIPWSTGLFYLDGTITIGNKTVPITAQALNTVPFSFFANKAGSLSGPDDIDSANELISNVTLSNSTLHIIENGVDHALNLSSLKDDADADPLNEIQNLSLSGTQLSLTGSATTINLSGVNTDSQSLSFNGSSLGISGGNSVDLSSLENDADADPANEIQTLSLNGSYLNISGANSPIYLAPFAGIDTDAQNLSFSNGTLSIERGSGVNLNPFVTLQQAYSGGSAIQLNGSSNFQIATNGGAPLFSTDNTNARIGIGTTAPATMLEIKSSSPSMAPDFRVGNSDATHMMNLFGGRAGDPNPFIAVSPADPLRFAHYNGVAFTERMRISPTGNFGLGTNNPQHKIHAIGNTSPTAHPEFSNTEAAFVFESTETNAASLSNMGLISLLHGTAQANYAIVGNTEDPAPNNRGVYGYAAGGTVDNIGVYGYANAAGPENIGVRGFAGGATINRGIIGHNTSAGTTNYGGYFHGRLGTANNYAVYAEATEAGTNNYGIYASATGAATNYAGYFSGAVNITGNTSIQGTLSTTGNATLDGTLTVAGNTNFASGFAIHDGKLWKGTTQLIDARNYGLYIGYLAGDNSTAAAFRNISIGASALQFQTTGSDNVAIGENTLKNSTNLASNTAVGSFAMASSAGVLTGNTALGAETLENLNAATFNTAIGYRAMENFTGGNYNVAVGMSSLSAAGTGGLNVAVGANAFNALTTGTNNTGIGSGVGSTITTESNNVIIGANANISAGVSNAVALGQGATASVSDAVILGNASNANIKIGIGTASPLEKLHVIGNALVTGDLTTTVVHETSDQRLKKDITQIGSALETVQKLRGVSYHWKKNTDQSLQHGVIAQEVEQILPEVVKTDENGFKSVNYSALIPFLLEAIKEQQKEIDELKRVREKQDAIESKLNALAAELNRLQDLSDHGAKRTSEK